MVHGISIHALREEGDAMMGAAYTADRYFYPRPPRGGRPLADLGCTITSEFLSTPSARRATASRSSSTRTSTFLSTPSARRATNYLAGPIGDFLISIHALREEGDLRLDQVLDLAAEFLSTPSARRATCRQHRHRGDSRYFYPRPPRGGRRGVCCCAVKILQISIHALREEGDG